MSASDTDVPEEAVEEVPTDDDAPEEEPNVAEVDLGSDDFGGNDLFSDVEDSSGGDGRDGGDADPFAEIDDGGAGGLATTINEGAARLAVVGLEEDEREGLRTEMEEVFAAFQLGTFGSRFMDEYVMVDNAEEIDPAWGLLGSALCCAAVALWLRPDSDEQVERLGEVLGNIRGGV